MVPIGGPGTHRPWILREDCGCFAFQGFREVALTQTYSQLLHPLGWVFRVSHICFFLGLLGGVVVLVPILSPLLGQPLTHPCTVVCHRVVLCASPSWPLASPLHSAPPHTLFSVLEDCALLPDCPFPKLVPFSTGHILCGFLKVPHPKHVWLCSPQRKHVALRHSLAL